MTAADTPAICRRVAEVLAGTGVAHRNGRLLYSSPSTLRPGPVLILGLNPGGTPREGQPSIAEDWRLACDRPAPWSAYLDETWGRAAAPGRHRLQAGLTRLLDPLDLREVPASNLVFVRSRNRAALPDFPELVRRCWPVHREILDLVRPGCVVAFGMEVADLLASLGEGARLVSKHPSLHGGWRPLRAIRVTLAGRRTTVLGLHHLGRYAIAADRKRDALEWARACIAEAASLA